MKRDRHRLTGKQTISQTFDNKLMNIQKDKKTKEKEETLLQFLNNK